MTGGRPAGRTRLGRLRPRQQAAATGPACEPASDTGLVELVGSGDPDALAVLYQRHGAACYRLARLITADVALAEDAVQEAFLGLWRAPGSYQQGRASVRSWLLALSHHKAVDLVRRETAQQRREAAQAAQQATSRDVGVDPAAAAWTAMQGAQVRAALHELPEPQRLSVTLAYFGGYTQSEIAAITGVPLGTVKTRTFSAMRALRLRLAPLAALAGDEDES